MKSKGPRKPPSTEQPRNMVPLKGGRFDEPSDVEPSSLDQETEELNNDIANDVILHLRRCRHVAAEVGLPDTTESLLAVHAVHKDFWHLYGLFPENCDVEDWM